MCVMMMTVDEAGKEYNVNYLFSFLVSKYHIQDRRTSIHAYLLNQVENSPLNDVPFSLIYLFA